MNYRVLFKILGLLIVIIGLTQLAPLLCALLYREREVAIDFGIAIGIAVVCGGALFLFNCRTGEEVYRREALAIVGLGWLLAGLIGALPYYIYGLGAPEGMRPFQAFVDCYFEALSGFTTTGASILTDIEVLPKGILFWRSFTHWLGGMGIIVLFIVILPFLGAGGKQLFRGEVSGPVKDGLRPRIHESAALLWGIYLMFTASETILLLICGLNFFDALTHTFATLSTGGFSNYNASIAHFDSVPAELVIILFMYLGGVNFALHFGVLRHGDWRRFVRDEEWQWFTLILVFAIFIVTVQHTAQFAGQAGLGRSLRESAFQTVSIMTCTGFATADSNLWSPLTKLLLVLLMFSGGCAGSTSGGLKIIRVITIFKAGAHHLEKVFSPRVVRKLRVGQTVIEDPLQNSVFAFFALCILIYLGGVLIIAALGYDLETSLTAVSACLFNVGPGFGRVGAAANYAFFDPAAKFILTLIMLLGRLEFYSLLVLCVPGFWRGK